MSIEPVLLTPTVRRTAQVLSQKLPTTLSASPQLVAVPSVLGAEASVSGQGLSQSMSLGRAALAVLAGLILFFVMGPRALKFAVKGATVIAQTLFNPKALTALVHKGMMLFGMLEAALPIARSFGLGNLRLPPQFAALAQHANRAQAGLSALGFASPMGAATSLASTAIPNMTQALPRAGEFASSIIRQAPPGLKQQAQVLLNGLAKVVNDLRMAAAPSLPASVAVNPLSVVRPV